MSTYKWPWPEELEPTPEELWQGLNEAPPEERRKLLEKMILNSREGAMCLMGNHDIEIRALRKELDDAQADLRAVVSRMLPPGDVLADDAKINVAPQMHAYLAPPEPKVGDTVYYLGAVDIQSLSIDSEPNAFGFTIELQEREDEAKAAREAVELCGGQSVHGPCRLPAGHNRGKPDVPENHSPWGRYPTLPLHRTQATFGVTCSTCDDGGCPDCTDPA